MRLSRYLYKADLTILEFPELRQTFHYDCGASALQSILIYYGYNVREDKIMRLAGTTDEYGTPIEGIEKVAKSYGLNVIQKSGLTINDVIGYIEQGYPVLMPIQAWSDEPMDYSTLWDEGHWVIAIGYDHEKIYFEDPSSVVRATIMFNELNLRWHDIKVDGTKLEHFAMIIQGEPKYTYNDHIVMEDKR